MGVLEIEFGRLERATSAHNHFTILTVPLLLFFFLWYSIKDRLSLCSSYCLWNSSEPLASASLMLGFKMLPSCPVAVGGIPGVLPETILCPGFFQVSTCSWDVNSSVDEHLKLYLPLWESIIVSRHLPEKRPILAYPLHIVLDLFKVLTCHCKSAHMDAC